MKAARREPLTLPSPRGRGDWAAAALFLLLLAFCAGEAVAGPTSWSFKHDMAGWKAEGYQHAGIEDGAFAGVLGPVPFLHSPELSLDAGKYRYLVIDLATTIGGTGNLYFRRQGEVLAEERKIYVSIPGGDAGPVVVDVWRHPLWTGTVTGVRLDVMYVPDVEVRIRSIRFAESVSAVVPAGGDFEQWDGQVPVGWRVWARQGSLHRAEGTAALAATGGQARVTIAAPVLFNDLGRYRLSGRYRVTRAGAGGELAVTVGYQDVLRRTLPENAGLSLHVARGEWRPFQRELTLPRLAARGSVSVSLRSPAAGALVQVDDVRLELLQASRWDDVMAPRTGFGWPAQWIWANDQPATDQVSRYCFRRGFDLADPAKVTQALLEASADNECFVYVNGRRLPPGRHAHVWEQPDVYDLKPYLVAGRNVIGIEAQNYESYAGAIAHLAVLSAGGGRLDVVTGPSWRCAAAPPDGWSRPDSDDAVWQPVHSFGKPPVEPWGERINYTYIGPKARLQILGLAAPSRLTAGETLTCRATLRAAAAAPAAEVRVELARGQDSGLTLGYLAVPALKAGQQHRLAGQWRLSRFLTPGAYRLRLVAPTCELVSGGKAAGQTVGLPVQVAAAPRAPIRTARFRRENGLPVVDVAGRRLLAFNNAVSGCLEPRTRLLTASCRQAGIHLQFTMLGDISYLGGNRFDFSTIDATVLNLLDADPDAYILLGLNLEGTRNSGLAAWDAEHPDEYTLDSGGRYVDKGPSFHAEGWQRRVEDLLRRIVRHVRGQAYASRVIGFVPCAGEGWEWQQWGSTTAPAKITLIDYSEGARQAFAAWARQRYGTLQRLNEAWATRLASWDEVRIPTPEQRKASDRLLFIDPARSRYESDFRRFYAEREVAAIIRLARAVKEESRGQALVGTYYGYVCYVTGGGRYHVTGHNAAHRYIESPYLDFSLSPAMYSWRPMGEGSGFMGPAASHKLNGKVWMSQVDHRTHHTTDPFSPTRDINDDIAVLARHFGQGLAAGVPYQIFDFSLGWTTGDPRLMQLLGRFTQVERQLLTVKRRPLDPERSIAVIMDEQAGDYTRLESNIHYDLLTRQLAELCKTGAGFDVYMMEDLARIPDGYRCYLFTNTFRISGAERRLIEQRLKRAGKTLIFLYAPGLTDGQRLDPGLVAEVTGIKMAVVEEERRLRITVTKGDSPHTACLPSAKVTYAGFDTYGPLFVPQEGQVLGTTEDGRPGLVVKRQVGWTAVYSAVSALPAPLLRGIMQAAGVQIPNPANWDVTYVGDRLVSIHSLTGGRRPLHLPGRQGVVTELLSGRTYPIHDGKAEVELFPRSTAIFLHP